MGLAGWNSCSQLQGRATGLSSRNHCSREPQSSVLDFPERGLRAERCLGPCRVLRAISFSDHHRITESFQLEKMFKIIEKTRPSSAAGHPAGALLLAAPISASP